MAPKWLQNGPPRGPGALLGASWLSTPLFCPYFCLQGASWSALGRLRGRSKVLLSGPWALQDGSQDSFQRSWGPKGSQNGAREGPKSGPGGDSNQKRDFFNNYCFFFQLILMIFEVLSSLFGAKNRSKMGSDSHLRRASPQKPSWKPLGTLLEALGAEKKISWQPLGRSWRPLGIV